MKRLDLRLIGALIAVALISACETATPYQPLQAGNATSGGYAEQKIGSDRFRVSFQGNSLTQRETVERYLLFRSAELTIQEGYDWFELVDRNTERHTRGYDVPITETYMAWTPTWYYLGNNRWTVINTWEPLWVERYEHQELTRYQASAEIFLGHGAKPAAESRAFDAHEVVANLGPAIQRPEVKG